MTDDSTAAADSPTAESSRSWTARTSQLPSPKLTFEAFELGREAAKQAIWASSYAPAGTHIGFDQEIYGLFVGRNVKTLADANDLLAERLNQIENRDYKQPYDRARHSMLCACRDTMNQVMNIAPELPSRRS